MKIALIGYGKMGKLIERSAQEKSHQIVAKTGKCCFPVNEIDQADVCIDFSHPDAVLENIQKLAERKKNIVVGTTGWYQHLDQVKDIVNRYQIGLLYSPNFSIGVNLFFNIVKAAAELMNDIEDYDVGMLEQHHNAKADSPSGTAKAIAEILVNGIKRKKGSLDIGVVRCGKIPGTHSVIFDSAADTITLTHEARNREGFARGAVVAAEWLQGKKGVFSWDDCRI